MFLFGAISWVFDRNPTVWFTDHHPIVRTFEHICCEFSCSEYCGSSTFKLFFAKSVGSSWQFLNCTVYLPFLFTKLLSANPSELGNLMWHIQKHGLINFIDTKANCRQIKILTCKGALQQVLVVYMGFGASDR